MSRSGPSQYKLSLWSKSFWRRGYESRGVVMFLALRLTAIVLSCLAVTLTTTAIHLVLLDAGETNGAQRFWGNIGWSAISLLTGHLNSLGGKDEAKHMNFTSAIYLMMGLNLLDIFVIILLRIPVEETRPQIILTSLCGIYRTVRTTVYLSLTFLMGSLSGIIWVYGPLQLRYMGAHPVIVGAALAAQGVGSEMTELFLSRRIIQSLGLWHAVNLCMVGMSVRLLAYGSGFTPWLCVPTEFAQGLTLGLFIKGSTALVCMAAQEGAEYHIEQVISTMYHGVGACFGAFVGGCLIYIFDTNTVYTACSIVPLVGICIHLFYGYSSAAVRIGGSEEPRQILVTFAPNTRGGNDAANI